MRIVSIYPGPQLYSWAIQCCNPVGCGQMSQYSSTLYIPSPPTNIVVGKFTYDGGNNIYGQVSWDAVYGATTYTYQVILVMQRESI